MHGHGYVWLAWWVAPNDPAAAADRHAFRPVAPHSVSRVVGSHTILMLTLRKGVRMDSDSPTTTCDARQPSVNSGDAFTANGTLFAEFNPGTERSRCSRSGAPPHHRSAGGYGHP